MGTVYKETFTKPLPAGAKIIVRKGQRLAQWQDAKGKTRTARRERQDANGKTRTARRERQDANGTAYRCRGSYHRRSRRLHCQVWDGSGNTYTDPKLLDMAGAMEALPALPPGAGPQREAATVSATGTDDLTPCEFAPKFATTIGKPCILGSILDKAIDTRGEAVEAEAVAVSACPVKAKSPLTIAVNGLCKERETELESATSSLGSPFLKPRFCPDFPRNIAILSLRTTISRARTRFQFSSENCGIFKIENRAKR